VIAAAANGQTVSPARQAELAGDFPTAEKAYEEELRIRPSADTWQRLGLTRHLQSKFGNAIPAFREALRLNPALWTSRLFLGMCLYRVNNFQEAQVEFERAEREVPPDDPGRDEIDYWLGATLIALKQPLAGLVAIERLLVRRGSRLDALELAVQTYADLSSSLWNRVAERSFESAAGYEVHGHALEADGNVEGALEAYRNSKALGPGRIGPGVAIGRILLAQGKPAEARGVLDGELKLVRPIPRRATTRDSRRFNSEKCPRPPCCWKSRTSGRRTILNLPWPWRRFTFALDNATKRQPRLAGHRLSSASGAARELLHVIQQAK
jgi:tetratricopeptide (TPR) repeat protein